MTKKELIEFIDNNEEKFNLEAPVLLCVGDNFDFVKFSSYLNITGMYSWTVDDGEVLKGEHGDVVTTWSEGVNGKIKFNEISDNKYKTLDDYFQNFTFDTVPPTINEFFESLHKLDLNEEGRLTALMSSMRDNPYFMIDSAEVIENFTLTYNDSYGHEHNGSGIGGVLMLKLGMNITQKFDPNANESAKSTKYVRQFESFRKNK